MTEIELDELTMPKCKRCGTTSTRSLVVCIDGTSNQFSVQNTNVVELYSRLRKDKKHRTFYNSGIGTYAKPHGLSPWQWFINVLDLAVAWRFDKVLLSAYRWLSENYEEGDRIFLFGFSRGAYQVRALSAMIHDVGLIQKGNQDQIPFAYKLYADPASRSVPRKRLPWYNRVMASAYHRIGRSYIPDKGGSPVNMADRFKATFSRAVNIHFVGVWDTVSSVGFLYGKTLPGTTNGMTHVCVFRHALAIHEHRVKFLPEFVGDPAERSKGSRDDEQETDVKEVWFAGSHSDIGGGNEPNMDLDRFGPSLRWMSLEGMLEGLHLLDAPRKWEDQSQGFEPYVSLTCPWSLLEIGCWPRLSFADIENKSQTTIMPHFGRWRRAWPDQRLHETALPVMSPSLSYDAALEGARDALRDAPEPEAQADRDMPLPEADRGTETRRGTSSGGRERVAVPLGRGWSILELERDPYLDAQRILPVLERSRLLSGSETDRLKMLLNNEAGQQSIRDAKEQRLRDASTLRSLYSKWGDLLLLHLKQWKITGAEIDIRRGLIGFSNGFVMVSRTEHSLMLENAGQIVKRVPTSADPLLVLVNSVVPIEFARIAPILCAAFIPLSTCVAFGALMGGRIWDYEAESSGQEFAPAATILALAALNRDSISPQGVSLTLPHPSRTARSIWNEETLGPVRMDHHAPAVRSFALSAHGTRLATGCANGTVYLWLSDNAINCPLLQPSETPLSGLSWSRNRRGTAEQTPSYAWTTSDVAVAETVSVMPSTGTGPFRDTFFIPDSADFLYVDSAAGDSKSSTWHVDFPGTALTLNFGSSDPIICVCFSPDGRYLACSSWRVIYVRPEYISAGVELPKPIRLSSNVLALAFEPDGKYLKAACQDGTVRYVYWSWESSTAEYTSDGPPPLPPFQAEVGLVRAPSPQPDNPNLTEPEPAPEPGPSQA